MDDPDHDAPRPRQEPHPSSLIRSSGLLAAFTWEQTANGGSSVSDHSDEMETGVGRAMRGCEAEHTPPLSAQALHPKKERSTAPHASARQGQGDPLWEANAQTAAR